MIDRRSRPWAGMARRWPWLVLGLMVVPAVWHVVDFPDDKDPEFPKVFRPTYSRRPPPAYRLAEPGDTIDRIALYVSALGVVLSASGLVRSPTDKGLWTAALALMTAAVWHGVTPGPTFDDWHGLGWRALFDARAPAALRIGLTGAALGLAGTIGAALFAARDRLPALWSEARARGDAPLWLLALALIAARQFDPPGVEPVGYWPRWALVWGLAAADINLARALGRINPGRPFRRRAVNALAGALVWLLIVLAGIEMTWYHRPLDRLRVIEPGRIYISAMPTERGLEIAQRRHHFKTIINLFPEDTPLRSPRHAEELRFATRHGITYRGSPTDISSSDAFLDTTLRLAQDPAAWPILVHCHGCMDRTPAWWGIYRFVVKGEALAAIMRDIERHRGYRPKASVTLLYNRVLPSRSPEHYRNDPMAADLRRYAAGTHDDHEDQVEAHNRLLSNLDGAPRVARRDHSEGWRPSLTPSGRSLEFPQKPRDRSSRDSASFP